MCTDVVDACNGGTSPCWKFAVVVEDWGICLRVLSILVYNELQKEKSANWNWKYETGTYRIVRTFWWLTMLRQALRQLWTRNMRRED